MKKLLIAVTCLPMFVNGQSVEFGYVDVNNLKARMDNNGRLFNNESTGSAAFEAPIGSGHNTLYFGGLWMAGMKNNNLKAAAQGFQNGDFQQGPVMDVSWYTSQSGIWQRVWIITKDEIDNHISNYANPGYVIPEAIENWPAHGDVSKGQAYYLAPFADTDGNGIYEPANGDYPKIKGDKTVYAIFNDDKLHVASGSDRFKMEIHATLYAFECSDYSVLNNTVFLDYDIINRSPYTYTDNYFGFMADFDIGCSNDDFVGCDVQRSMFYGYNGDVNDEACTGSNGYGDYPAAQGVMFLNGPVQDADEMDNPYSTDVEYAIDFNGISYPGLGTGFNDGIIDNERINMRHFMYYFRDDVTPLPAQGEPSTGYDYYRYLKGFWFDGTPVYYGGTGHMSSAGAIYNGLVEYDYMFPGDSDPLMWGSGGNPIVTPDWNEITEGNQPADRRGVGSTGPFTFFPNETLEIDLAFVFARSSIANDNIDAVNVLKQRATGVRNYYNLNATPCGGTFGLSAEEISNEEDFEVFPNPADDFLFVKLNSAENSEIEIHDLSGRIVLSQSVPNGSKELVMDVKSLASGTYFVVMKSNVLITVRKIIIH